MSTKDNVNLAKQLRNEFKRSIYWNNYQTILAKVMNKGTNTYELLSASFPGVKRLSVLAYVINAGVKKGEVGRKTIESIFFQEERLKSIMY